MVLFAIKVDPETTSGFIAIQIQEQCADVTWVTKYTYRNETIDGMRVEIRSSTFPDAECIGNTMIVFLRGDKQSQDHRKLFMPAKYFDAFLVAMRRVCNRAAKRDNKEIIVKGDLYIFE